MDVRARVAVGAVILVRRHGLPILEIIEEHFELLFILLLDLKHAHITELRAPLAAESLFMSIA